MINFRMLKLSDPWLWFSTGALLIIGLLAIFSATFRMQLKAGLDPFIFIKRQFISLVLAFIGLALFTYLDYQHLKKAALYLYGFTLFLLAAIWFTGSSAQGAQRWLQLGFFSFQPSEISKLVIIIALAVFLGDRVKLKSLWGNMLLLALAGAPFFLIFKQPDLGTALVFGVILIGMLTAAGTAPRLLIFLVTPFLSILLRHFIWLWPAYLLMIALALFLMRSKVWDWILILGLNITAGVAFPFLWGLLKIYQQQRIISFLNPSADPYGAGYHSLQSMIAVGGGGFLGKGFLRGTQTQLQFIPEQHSDFIFSVIGEEFGFIGAVFVLGLFLLMIWRALMIADQARDFIGKMLAAGIAVMLAFHVFANSGMVIGILPVVGIPLPFMSFGGSALFANLSAIGILQSIAMRRQKIIF